MMAWWLRIVFAETGVLHVAVEVVQVPRCEPAENDLAGARSNGLPDLRPAGPQRRRRQVHPFALVVPSVEELPNRRPGAVLLRIAVLVDKVSQRIVGPTGRAMERVRDRPALPGAQGHPQ